MNDSPLPKLILKKGRERSLIRRHPWVFSGGVEKLPLAGPGEIILVCDNAGMVLGRAFFDPNSQIVARVFDFSIEEGLPDDAFWNRKFENALRLRKEVLSLKNTSGFRLFHAEGDMLPGIIADIYGNAASLQLRIPGVFHLKEILATFLQKKAGIENIFVSEATGKTGEENRFWLRGKNPGVVPFLENGLIFSVEIEEGQKTGYFLDQRDNREWVRNFSKGRKVADLFSYAGGFATYALAGGATSVTAIDSSQTAVLRAKENLEHNFPNGDFKIIKADCFQFLKEMQQNDFDLIVLDPPAFTKHISTVAKATRGYKEINLKAMKKISPGGLLFSFSCSQHISSDLFRKILFGAATDAGREVQILHQLRQGADHPVDIFHPEGEYLKGFALLVN